MLNFLKTIIETINNSKFLTVLLSVIFLILAIEFIIYIIKLLRDIRKYIVNKSNSFYLANQKNTNVGNATLSMMDRLEQTNSILDIITFMITNEITSYFRQYIALNTLYEISNIDKDIETISKTVFNGLNKDIFKDPNLILTEKYLMEYITKKSMSTMLEVAQAHNANVRGTNQSTGD